MSPPDDDKETAAGNVLSDQNQTPTPPWWSFTSILGKIETEMDEQRHERLAQCRTLESVLADCKAQMPNRTQLEDVPSGIRMVRYFDWRDVPDPHCQREAHAVWACRAVALKCGGDLLKVRDCFHNGIPGSKSKTAILNYSNGAAAYESSRSAAVAVADDDDNSMTTPCAKFQETLGRCVSTNAHALLERDAARRRQN